MDVKTTSYIALAIPHPLPFVQCFLWLFFTFKLENDSLKASYSNIGWPWLKMWKIIAYYIILFMDERWTLDRIWFRIILVHLNL